MKKYPTNKSLNLIQFLLRLCIVCNLIAIIPSVCLGFYSDAVMSGACALLCYTISKIMNNY